MVVCHTCMVCILHYYGKEDTFMATKSITKNVNITSRAAGRNLVFALENAHSKKSKEVSLQRTFSELKGDEIKKLFGVN